MKVKRYIIFIIFCCQVLSVYGQVLIGAPMTKGPRTLNALKFLRNKTRNLIKLNNLKDVHTFTEKNSKVNIVPQGYYSVLDFSSEENPFNYIGSSGAYPCLNVAFISSSANRVVFGHFQASNVSSQSVHALLKHFDVDDPPVRVILSSYGVTPGLLSSVIESSLDADINDIRFIGSDSLYIRRNMNIYINFLVSNKSNLSAEYLLIPGS